MRAQLTAGVLALGGLLTAALATGSEARTRGYSLELVDDHGAVLPTYQKDGRTYVLGKQGHRYSLHLTNRSNQRVEFVAAVDGRDVLDGEPSNLAKRGYIVQPHGTLNIDGFRLDSESVAAFRFSSVQKSYAGKMGDARDVGVIGVAVFAERQLPPPVDVVPPQPVYAPPGDRRGMEGQLGTQFNGFGTDKSAPASEDLMASNAEASRMEKKQSRPGLGTEFGEQRASHTDDTTFDRASDVPAAVLSLRYNDRGGLLALGIDVDGLSRSDLGMRETAEPFRRNGYAQPPVGWNGN